jgi:hypothetical protein
MRARSGVYPHMRISLLEQAQSEFAEQSRNLNHCVPFIGSSPDRRRQQEGPGDPRVSMPEISGCSQEAAAAFARWRLITSDPAGGSRT